jgi:hypothetical protein
VDILRDYPDPFARPAAQAMIEIKGPQMASETAQFSTMTDRTAENWQIIAALSLVTVRSSFAKVVM